MAIDADLNAGFIDDKKGHKERKKIINFWSKFYGAMDGSSKFVKGDAKRYYYYFINLIGDF